MSKYAALGQGILAAGSALQGAVGNIVQSRQNQSWLELQREQMRQTKARQDREEAERNLRLELELAPMLSGARSVMEEYAPVPDGAAAGLFQQSVRNGNEGSRADAVLRDAAALKSRLSKDLPDLATLRSLGPEGTTAREKVFSLNEQLKQRQAQTAKEDAARKALAESNVFADLLRVAGVPDEQVAQIAGSGVGATAPLASIAGRLITAKSRKEIAGQKPAGGGGGGSAQEKRWLDEAKSAGFFKLPPEGRAQAIAELQKVDPRKAAYLSRIPAGPGDAPQTLKLEEWMLREQYKNALQNGNEKLAAEIKKQIAKLYGPSDAERIVDAIMSEPAQSQAPTPTAPAPNRAEQFTIKQTPVRAEQFTIKQTPVQPRSLVIKQSGQSRVPFTTLSSKLRMFGGGPGFGESVRKVALEDAVMRVKSDIGRDLTTEEEKMIRSLLSSGASRSGILRMINALGR